LTSLVLGGIFYGLALALRSVPPLLALAEYLAYINVLLAVFNLIPGFPLDGGRVFRSIVWAITGNPHKATDIAGTLGRIIGFLFILVGVYLVIGGNFLNGIWLGFIGWFLESAAASEVQQQKIHELLAGHTVSQAMSSNYTTIPPDMTLQQLVDNHILGNGQRSFMVEEGDKVDGLLTLHDLKEQPRQEWGMTRVSDVMVPLERLKRTQPNAELWDAAEEMNRDGVNQLPVMTDGQMVGMLRREDLISYLRNLQEFRR
jgi:CBS domain-containing protein